MLKIINKQIKNMEAFQNFKLKQSENIYWDLLKRNNTNYYIAMSDKGLISLSLGGNNFEEFTSSIKKVVNDPQFVHDSSKLSDAKAQLTDYFEGSRKTFDLPLDLRGTEFQKSVWNSLLSIPFGETRSYLEIAKDIGNEKAVRAVGGACGANHVPIIVPCHRVLGKSGTMTGFSAFGGVSTKEALLKHEGYF